MGVYYPSVAVELLLRLEEGAGPSAVQAEQPRTGQGVPVPAGGLQQLLSVPGTDPYSHRLVFRPAAASWERNTPREADTAEVSLRWRDLPLDPRSIRSAVLLIYAGVIPAEWWSPGVSAVAESEARLSYIARSRGNLRFVGHADKWDLDAGESGDGLTFSARDFTALLIDRPVPTSVLRAVQLGAPLLQAVAEIVHSLPATQGLPVVADPDIDQAPLLLSSLRHVLSADGTRGGRHGLAGEQTTYWDLVTDLCLASGVVPVVEIDQLRLRRPRTLYAGRQAGVPSMVWGANLSRLGLSRSFGRTALQPIEVRCFDPRSKRTESARFPANPRAAATPGGSGSDVTYRIKVVHGVDPARLAAIAEATYYEAAQQQLEVELETRDMSSFGVDMREASLLGLAAGDPLNVLVRDPEQGTLQELFRPLTVAQARSWSPDQIAGELQRRGLSRTVSAAMATALRQADTLSTFRVKRASHSFDAETGYNCSISGTSFITVDGGTP